MICFIKERGLSMQRRNTGLLLTALSVLIVLLLAPASAFCAWTHLPYGDMTQNECRMCHGGSTEKWHHSTEKAKAGECLDCHCSAGVVASDIKLLNLDCLQCHGDGAQPCAPGSDPLPDPGAGDARYRPNRPVMDFVPQNIGISDRLYPDLTDSDCTACHSSPSGEVHHLTDKYNDGLCLSCHEEYPIVEPVQSCTLCHTDDETTADPYFYAQWGGAFAYPHHKGADAAARDCLACHDPFLVSRTDTISPSVSAPSAVTPTPAACENCHFWDDPIDPTIHGPGSMVSWGPSAEGMHPDRLALGFDPGNLPSQGVHMETNGIVSDTCVSCHAEDLNSPEYWDPYGPQPAIRYCENCHDRFTLHANPGHTSTDNIYTVNGIPNQEVTAEQKCVACHEIGVGWEKPPPVIDRIRNRQCQPGETIKIRGSNFGASQKANVVHIGRKVFGRKTPESDHPKIILWSDTKIEVKIPNYKCKSFKGLDSRKRKVRVTVYGQDSNKKRIKVLKPDKCY